MISPRVFSMYIKIGSQRPREHWSRSMPKQTFSIASYVQSSSRLPFFPRSLLTCRANSEVFWGTVFSPPAPAKQLASCVCVVQLFGRLAGPPLSQNMMANSDDLPILLQDAPTLPSPFKRPLQAAPMSKKKRKTSESSDSSRSRNSSQAAILGPELNELVEADKRLSTIISYQISEKELINDEELQQLIKSAYWNKNKSELKPEKVQLFAEKINKYIKQRIDNNESSAMSRKKKEDKLKAFESQVKVLQSEKSDCLEVIQTLKAELEKVQRENMSLKSQVEKLSQGQATLTLVEVNKPANDQDFYQIANEVLKEGYMLRDLTTEELGEGGVAVEETWTKLDLDSQF